MANRKIACKNTLCRFQKDGDICIKSHIDIGYNGCETFKPDLCYYTNKVWNKLSSNFICTYPGISDELRIGLYVVACLWDLKIANDTSRGMIYFATEDSGPLNHAEIVARPLNHEQLNRFVEMIATDTIESLLVKSGPAEDAVESEAKPYGWLSPTGVFTEANWARHDDAAHDIIKAKHFEDEFDEWTDLPEHHCCKGAREFLSEVKGYVLIHDPSNLGYIVSNVKPMTKSQKEFLFNYFTDMGDSSRAKTYLED